MRDGVPGGHLGAAQQQLAGERGTVQSAGAEYGMCRPGSHTDTLTALADRPCPQLPTEAEAAEKEGVPDTGQAQGTPGTLFPRYPAPCP
ncbi:hypothetical protein GCM10010343_25720 [Streptomyces avidinii]|nr:hypothetical protein GCM10010343_25720 [Streptomyces avidinii]